MGLKNSRHRIKKPKERAIHTSMYEQGLTTKSQYVLCNKYPLKSQTRRISRLYETDRRNLFRSYSRKIIAITVLNCYVMKYMKIFPDKENAKVQSKLSLLYSAFILRLHSLVLLQYIDVYRLFFRFLNRYPREAIFKTHSSKQQD